MSDYLYIGIGEPQLVQVPRLHKRVSEVDGTFPMDVVIQDPAMADMLVAVKTLDELRHGSFLLLLLVSDPEVDGPSQVLLGGGNLGTGTVRGACLADETDDSLLGKLSSDDDGHFSRHMEIANDIQFGAHPGPGGTSHGASVSSVWRGSQVAA